MCGEGSLGFGDLGGSEYLFIEFVQCLVPYRSIRLF